ncbi:unnamed protein product [Caenorhabditis auriculariae]|uniref:Uncharacterized protein n=1 Tax=Caenorhabditis auriculariae TaxID=2777116 RepID=A0A8S1HFX7_9PELO|nr:unnamed protein product [Caenorhabditis auriculariae]
MLSLIGYFLRYKIEQLTDDDVITYSCSFVLASVMAALCNLWPILYSAEVLLTFLLILLITFVVQLIIRASSMTVQSMFIIISGNVVCALASLIDLPVLLATEVFICSALSQLFFLVMQLEYKNTVGGALYGTIICLGWSVAMTCGLSWKAGLIFLGGMTPVSLVYFVLAKKTAFLLKQK